MNTTDSKNIILLQNACRSIMAFNAIMDRFWTTDIFKWEKLRIFDKNNKLKYLKIMWRNLSKSENSEKGR